MEIRKLLYSYFVISSMTIALGETYLLHYNAWCGNVNIATPYYLLDRDYVEEYYSRFEKSERIYKLFCENNRTVIYLTDSIGHLLKYSCATGRLRFDHPEVRKKYRYYVEAINHNNYTIRLVAPDVSQNNCSSFPLFSLGMEFFEISKILHINLGGHLANKTFTPVSQIATFLSCEERVNSSSYMETSPCINSSAFSQSTKMSYSYVVVDNDFSFSDLEESCRVELVTMISTRNRNLTKKMSSYTEVHSELAYGFELSWANKGESNKTYSTYQDNSTSTSTTTSNESHPNSSEDRCFLCKYSFQINFFFRRVFIFIVIPRMVCVVLISALLIYTWYNRHSSMINGIEEFLLGNNGLTPIRYSYWKIIVMTRFFKEKLGEGGFGSVYKGTLSNGRLVAIKILEKSKGDGQDFINEIATIGKIHHVNVVRLVGYCATSSKRALVYDFMPNGSLDKYIFSKEGVTNDNNKPLSCKEIFEISLGVSRGISYLHQGCNMQILHFDIKPHNILLDESFVPKVSDFGLARLCPLDKSTVLLTAVRGTIGYIAPELIYKYIGPASHKSDVYSFGMLLFEMASRRRNVRANVERSSQIYFPTWIYNQLNEGRKFEIEEDANDEEIETIKKMIVVALWCIQLEPNDRPSMSQVTEMLEGEFESLEMPPKPLLFPQGQEYDNLDHDGSETTSQCSLPSNEDRAET